MFRVSISIERDDKREETKDEYYNRTGRSDYNQSSAIKESITTTTVVGNGTVTADKMFRVLAKAEAFLGIHEEE